METFRLLVVVPPQDSEMAILTLRSYIFSECGFTSALALPAIIPLFPLPADIPVKDIRATLDSQSFTGCTITSSKITTISGSLFLTIHGGKALQDITTQFRDLLVHPPSGNADTNEQTSFPCFPFYDGFFLARNEQNIGEKDITKNISTFPVLNFDHFFISILVMHIYSGLEKWWENIKWEIPITIKSRK